MICGWHPKLKQLNSFSHKRYWFCYNWSNGCHNEFIHSFKIHYLIDWLILDGNFFDFGIRFSNVLMIFFLSFVQYLHCPYFIEDYHLYPLYWNSIQVRVKRKPNVENPMGNFFSLNWDGHYKNFITHMYKIPN